MPQAASIPRNDVQTRATRIRGIDVSAWQGDVRQRQVREAGYRFVYMKATEGLNYTSPRFAPEWREAREEGLYRGAYHFFHPLEDPIGQAERFLERMGPMMPGVLPPVLDMEGYNGIKGVNRPVAFCENAQLFLDFVSSTLQLPAERDVGLYLGHWFWRSRLKPAPRSSDLFRYWLWLPSYTPTPRPMPWTNGYGGEPWRFWQFSGSGSVPGVDGRCDLNVFSGSEADLAMLAGGAPR